uniref:Uncharacterized protein n=1 Tax=Oryza barthii TaxID=65489 RepID=A0A0D3FDY5_9ORYZ
MDPLSASPILFPLFSPPTNRLCLILFLSNASSRCLHFSRAPPQRHSSSLAPPQRRLLLSTAAFFPRAILSSSSATHTPSSAASYFLRRRPAHKVARSGRGLAGSCGDGEQRSSLHLAAAGNSGVIGGAPLRIWRRRGAAVAAVSGDDYHGDRPDEAKHGALAPPTRGLGLWLRGSRAQARRFDRFLCKRGIGLQSHSPH